MPRVRSNDPWSASTRSTRGSPALRPIDAPLSATSLEIVAIITCFKRHVVLILIRGPRVHSIGALRSRSIALNDATSPAFKETVWISPTRLKLLKPVGFISPNGLRGLNTFPVYGKLKTPIYIVYNININIYAA